MYWNNYKANIFTPFFPGTDKINWRTHGGTEEGTFSENADADEWPRWGTQETSLYGSGNWAIKKAYQCICSSIRFISNPGRRG